MKLVTIIYFYVGVTVLTRSVNFTTGSRDLRLPFTLGKPLSEAFYRS